MSLAMVLALLVPAMASAQAGKTSFAGKWEYNQSKSDLGTPGGPGGQGGGQRMGGGFGGGSLSVTQDANSLTLERSRTNQEGQVMTTTEKYTLDGKESINQGPRGESKSVATWSADGKTLTVVTTRVMNFNGESRELKTTAVWTLVDANTLSVVSTSATPNGDRVLKMIYDKK